MKKYIIIAAAALVAATACSKVETTIETPDEAITFKVVDYSTPTRADEYNSLISENIYQFTTYAWHHSGTGANATASPFMIGQVIKPDSNENPSEWAPEGRAYYWPKSEDSYINFFSFAGSKVPESMGTEGQVAFSNVTIGKTDNILVADAAYGYKKNNKKANNDPGYYLDNVKEGVPTLFRHVLAQVYFDVKLDATVVDDENYEFTAVIDELTLTCANKGSLSLAFSAPSSTPGQSKFTTTDGWVAGEGTGSLAKTETVSLTAKGTKVQPESGFSKLMDWSSVMPQDLSNVKVSFKYTLTTKWTAPEGSSASSTNNSETITVADVPLSKFTPTVTKWDMNTRYTYHITINPVSGDKILFDPAVEKWAEAPAASYTYPEAATPAPVQP